MKDYSKRYNEISNKLSSNTWISKTWVNDNIITDNTNPLENTFYYQHDWIYQPPYNDHWKWNDYNPYQPTITTTNLRTFIEEETGYIMKKVAVFKVERDKKTSKVVSAELIEEMWIPSDVDASLYVAKKLTKDGKELDEKNTIVKEILSVSL